MPVIVRSLNVQTETLHVYPAQNFFPSEIQTRVVIQF